MDLVVTLEFIAIAVTFLLFLSTALFINIFINRLFLTYSVRQTAFALKSIEGFVEFKYFCCMFQKIRNKKSEKKRQKT